MMPSLKSLLNDIPPTLPEELCQTLLQKPTLRIERILSQGHQSPADFWYDQDQDEWVLLVEGHARLSFANGESTTLHAGDYLFREGDPFEAIAAVRAGSVKTCVTDREGHEHVLGFHFPGEVIGLNAIDGHRYPCDAIALDTVMLCRFSFPKISVLATRVPGVQRELFRLLSRDIGRAALLAGDWSADQRVAAFLVGMSRRLSARGFSSTRFQLTMARTDIANYLRLAPETVSRVLRRMQDDGVLAVDRREVELLDAARLETLSAPILRD